MFYTVIKHFSHLRTLGKCRKHSPAARAFYISLEFSNAWRVLSQCKTRLRLLYLLTILLDWSAINQALTMFWKPLHIGVISKLTYLNDDCGYRCAHPWRTVTSFLQDCRIIYQRLSLMTLKELCHGRVCACGHGTV